MSGTGRLPSLSQPNKKPGLKFTPKAVARRSKEERDASAPKIKPEEVKPFDNKKKYSKKANGTTQQQKRVPRYLTNTRLISTGPLAAGNFVGGSNDMRGGFIKTEGSNSELLRKGLMATNGGDEEDSDSEESKDLTKINMGREYKVYEINEDDDEPSDVDMDEEAVQSKRVADLFPVRAVRVKHEDMEIIKKDIQESMSDATTRDPTPGLPKLEDSDGNSLQNVIKQRDIDLQEKLNDLRLQNEFQSVDHEEAAEEVRLLTEDYRHIVKKLDKINDKPNRFMFFQLPAELPEFEETGQKPATVESEEGQEETPEPKPLVGNIGTLRIHKSGKLSVKLGNVVMDISRGAEASFLQDVVALDEREDEHTVELLGQIDGKVVVTPKF